MIAAVLNVWTQSHVSVVSIVDRCVTNDLKVVLNDQQCASTELFKRGRIR